MRKFITHLSFALLFAFVQVQPTFAQSPGGQVAGKAVVEGKPLPNIQVRIRDVNTGQLVSTATTNANGEYNFSSLPAGSYTV